MDDKKIKITHRFLDEAGDTTFYGKGRKPIIGQPGVSLTFGLGMLKINDNLVATRQKIIELQHSIEKNGYLNVIPSIRKKIASGGFYLHASDDPPEVRQLAYELIKQIDCSLEMMVARKIPAMFLLKHNRKESEFYADVLSHLLKNKLASGHKYVLNIAHRANSTSNRNLQTALEKAHGRAQKKHVKDDLTSLVVFNVQNPRTEPLINIADYLCWAVQRVFEKGETRFYNYMLDKISLVVDIYDRGKYYGSRNYYKRGNPLTEANKISPPPS
jgi:hypothetical protein